MCDQQFSTYECNVILERDSNVYLEPYLADSRAVVWCANCLCAIKKEETRTTKSNFSLLIFSTVKRINGILGDLPLMYRTSF